MPELSRMDQRKEESELTRIRMLEKDADDAEERQDRIEKRMGWILATLVGALISFTTAAIVLAWQIALTNGAR